MGEGTTEQDKMYVNWWPISVSQLYICGSPDSPTCLDPIGAHVVCREPRG